MAELLLALPKGLYTLLPAFISIGQIHASNSFLAVHLNIAESTTVLFFITL